MVVVIVQPDRQFTPGVGQAEEHLYVQAFSPLKAVSA